MSLDAYLLVKSLHIISVITLTGGMLATVLAMQAARLGVEPRLIAPVVLWDQRVTSPALLLLWCFGLLAWTWGGWGAAHWLQAKVAIAALLSGLHGVNAGRLRRLVRGAAANPSIQPGLILVLAGTAVALAVLKPL